MNNEISINYRYNRARRGIPRRTSFIKGYIVHGVKRRASLINTYRIDHLYVDPHENHANFQLHYGDMTDSTNLIRIIQETQPDEIYNLAAMSHVKVSFDNPEYTANADGIGTLRLLEAIRILKLEKKTRIYQASTSELFGLVQEVPQKETTPFYPRSPYGVAKLYAYWIMVNYREAYKMFACNGILFNHESPLRGETFVTTKNNKSRSCNCTRLTGYIISWKFKCTKRLGACKDYVDAMWRILQQEEPEDFVIATGITTTVRDFAKWHLQRQELKLNLKAKENAEKGIVNAAKTRNINYLSEKKLLLLILNIFALQK